MKILRKLIMKIENIVDASSGWWMY